jgi:hypothetical protein
MLKRVLKWIVGFLIIFSALLPLIKKKKNTWMTKSDEAAHQSSNGQYQITFLPYFPKTNFNVTVNRLHLFNWWAYGDSYISDESLRERVSKIISIYVDKSLDPLKSPTVAILDGNYSFSALSGEQMRDLDRYVLSLLFCSLTQNSEMAAGFHSICTSENFSLFHQNFNLSDEFIGYTTGSYFRVNNVNSLDGARLVKPDFIPDVLIYGYDSTLYEALCKAVDAHDADDDFIFRALEWIRFAYMNAEGFNYPSRVVMISTAYEILFDLPDWKKEDRLADGLESLIQPDKMGQSGLPKVRKPNVLGKYKENTMYGWWARDFYHLRSQIVHGSSLAQNDYLNHNKVEHFYIALWMLRFCLYRLLEAKGYLIYKEYPSFGKVGKYMDEKRLRGIEKLIG